MFKEKIKDPTSLSLNFSLDGAQLFKSSKKAFWPLQLHLNCLTEKIRFKHPILTALWQTEKEPSPAMLDLILKTLKIQCEEINNKGGVEIINIETNKTTKKNVSLYCGCVDSVARPIMQNRFQFNAHFGCSYCYHGGEYFARSMRYPNLLKDPKLRTHKSHLKDIKRLKKQVLKASKNSSKKPTGYRGVKGKALLQQILTCDIVWSLPIDYLHATLLGVVKQLHKFWKKLLSKADYAKIKERMSHVKLSKSLSRSLRSLDYASKYKALEWKLWLLFVSVPCLEGILEADKFHSYLLLVDSIFTLLKEAIPVKELKDKDYELLKFVGECELFYGKQFLTFNTHILRHYVDSVRKTGPLWANSAFPFESAIGKFIQQINAPNGCLKQIATKWMRKITFETYVANNSSNSQLAVSFCKSVLLDKPLLKNVTELEDVTLIGNGTTDDKIQDTMRKLCKNENITTLVYDRCIFKSQFIHSVHYKRITKTDDSIVKLVCGKVIEVQAIIKADDQCFICGYEWLISENEFNKDISSTPIVRHILKVTEKTKKLIFAEVHSVLKKMMVVDTGEKLYVTYLPNNYESH